MALGDSITAGLLAKSTRAGPLHHLHAVDDGAQLSFQPASNSVLPRLDEYRGVSYSTGNDPGAISIASILLHYSPNLTGASIGHHPPVKCVGPVCERPEGDGLNAAVSGSLADSLFAQVEGMSLGLGACRH